MLPSVSGSSGLKPFSRRVATGEEESRERTTPETNEEAGVASTGREILGEYYDDEHLTYEEIRGLGLGVVTEKGETVPTDELQVKIFRILDQDDASGYVVSPTETTGTATVLCYLQAS
jgi:hypothetical protein